MEAIMKWLILASCVALSLATDGWTSCGGSATEVSLLISGCSEVPCHFKAGEDIDISVLFFSGSETTNISTSVYIIFTDLFPLDITDEMELSRGGCEKLQIGDCPLELQEYVLYFSEAKVINMPGIWGVSLPPFRLPGFRLPGFRLPAFRLPAFRRFHPSSLVPLRSSSLPGYPDRVPHGGR
ncbi:unnamed protein product [Darwinula stevensoni]|uniref:MD-2-related lipid-recognition domain-containing protein n=1 Tax=Darwinula stevensoni TaxID=69355 RepID=A0A7R8XBV3_9CRUS|nr:unnamed protein product [Darwinula stevensoni]CAG0885217.1 unnamed protein product [Darwinula stevensoni]